MSEKKFDITEAKPPCYIDLTQEDLDRGLTTEEIARDRADLNIKGFCQDLAKAIQEAAAKHKDTVGAA